MGKGSRNRGGWWWDCRMDGRLDIGFRTRCGPCYPRKLGRLCLINSSWVRALTTPSHSGPVPGLPLCVYCLHRCVCHRHLSTRHDCWPRCTALPPADTKASPSSVDVMVPRLPRYHLCVGDLGVYGANKAFSKDEIHRSSERSSVRLPVSADGATARWTGRGDGK